MALGILALVGTGAAMIRANLRQATVSPPVTEATQVTDGGNVSALDIPVDSTAPKLIPGTAVPLPDVTTPTPAVPAAERREPLAVPGNIENPGAVAVIGADGTLEAAGRADVAGVPAAVLEDCDAFFEGEIDETMRAKVRDGLPTPDFAVSFRGLVNPYAMMALMIAPGETVRFAIHHGEGTFHAEPTAGTVSEVDGPSMAWNWTLPSNPGIHCLKIENKDTGKSMCLQGLVTVPYTGQDTVEGYRIGAYEKQPMGGKLRYSMPKALIRVAKDDSDTWVTPHLQIHQFLCKQTGGYPKFLLLETRLLLKLEAIVAKLESVGIQAHALYITSGYRTPHYNRVLGNETSYSRHVYGDAADIFIDVNNDYKLDDLNRDGKVNDRDALYLSNVIDDVTRSLPEHFEGGLGFYGFLASRTAFVHTDTRGYGARWGFPTGLNAAGSKSPAKHAASSASVADGKSNKAATPRK